MCPRQGRRPEPRGPGGARDGAIVAHQHDVPRQDGPRAAPERVGPRSPDGARDARAAAAVERATGGRPAPGRSAPNGLRKGPHVNRRRRAGERRRPSLRGARNVAAALENLGTDTTYLCCVDAAGNACSFICSNFEAFGSGLVPEGCGFSCRTAAGISCCARGIRIVLGLGSVGRTTRSSQAW